MLLNLISCFFNDDETTTSNGAQNEKGTELGLRIYKEIVENNGGKIEVKRKLNQGTTFYFTVPKPKKTNPILDVNIL